jgi:hypothetical protein
MSTALSASPPNSLELLRAGAQALSNEDVAAVAGMTILSPHARAHGLIRGPAAME